MLTNWPPPDEEIEMVPNATSNWLVCFATYHMDDPFHWYMMDVTQAAELVKWCKFLDIPHKAQRSEVPGKQKAKISSRVL